LTLALGLVTKIDADNNDGYPSKTIISRNRPTRLDPILECPKIENIT